MKEYPTSKIPCWVGGKKLAYAHVEGRLLKSIFLASYMRRLCKNGISQQANSMASITLCPLKEWGSL